MPAVGTTITHFSATILARSSSTSSTNKRAIAEAIVGGIIGTLACFTTIGIIYWSYFRRPRSRYRSPRIDLLGPDESAKATSLSEVNDSELTFGSTTLFTPTPPIHITLPMMLPPIHNTTRARVTTITEPSHGSLVPSFDTTPSCTLNPGTGLGTGVRFRSRSPSPLPRFQIANPDPQSESLSTNRLRSPHRAELKAQIVMLREEINGLKVDLKKSGPFLSASATNTGTTSHAVGSSSSSDQLQAQLEDSVGTLCSGSGLSEPESQAHTQAHNERVISLHLPSP